MKIKLLVLAAAISPAMALIGQNTATLYNQGKMVVKGTDPTNTVLFIKGDFVSGSSTDGTTTSQITLTNSRTVLTGDFKHDALASSSNVFTPVGTETAESTANSVFEFRGTTKQNITTDGTSYATIPSKATSFINFPTLEINNKDSVILDPALAVQTVNLNLSVGTFSLNGVRVDDTNKGRYFSDNLDLSGTVNNPDERSVLGHLKVTGTTQYSNIATADPANRSFVRVIIPFDKSGSYTNANGRYGSIVGLGIPFQKLKSDYFSWNSLLTPVGNAKGNDGTTFNSYFGPNNLSVTNPYYELKPGVGYIIGNELRGTDYADYAMDNTIAEYNKSEINFNARFKGEYVFDRAYFAAIPNSNNFFESYAAAAAASTVPDAYAGEILNTTGDGVQVRIYPGYNYLANPYTSPLDISKLLVNQASVLPDWNVRPGATKGSRDILNRVWIMSGASKGSAKFNMFDPNGSNITGKSMQVTVSTYLAKTVGGTYVTSDGETARTLIPPLQMFIIKSEVETTITIPRSAQVMGDVSFIRSTDFPYDDFMFEVVDRKTETSDRVSVVLRPKSEIISNPEYTNVTKFNPNSKADNETKSTDSELTQSVGSQLYTLNDSGNPLVAKYIGYTPNVDSKVSTPLYLKPSNRDQDIVIKGYRLGSLTNFESVILVDKLLGKEVFMTPGVEYATTVKSTDADDRFVLIFSRGTDGIEDEITDNSKSINSYYANGVLTVNGFKESDFGSKLTVYDMQGRQVAFTTVNDFEVKVTADFVPGAFIVKVAGNNNSYVAKFLVK